MAKDEMRLLSVNIGQPTPFKETGPGVTGIFKTPYASAEITKSGLSGDAVCDTKHHGSVDQAVYVYGQPDYDWWSQELGRPLAPGTFGENLTISNLLSGLFHVGDRLVIGEVILEVTAPRIPCRTLAARMEDKLFVKRFLAADRPGLYCRVVTPGTVREGDPVQLHAYSGEKVSLLEMCRTWSEKTLPPEVVARYLATPIHEVERKRLSAFAANSTP